MRYEVGKDFDTKDWFVYDNETNRNVCICNTEEEAQKVVEELKEESVKRCGNLTIYDYGTRGLSWERHYFDKWLGRETKDYNGISGDDMLDYTFEELVPYNFESIFTKEEQEFFVKEFYRIKANARHKDYYDAYDNLWKNY